MNMELTRYYIRGERQIKDKKRSHKNLTWMEVIYHLFEVEFKNISKITEIEIFFYDSLQIKLQTPVKGKCISVIKGTQEELSKVKKAIEFFEQNKGQNQFRRNLLTIPKTMFEGGHYNEEKLLVLAALDWEDSAKKSAFFDSRFAPFKTFCFAIEIAMEEGKTNLNIFDC